MGLPWWSRELNLELVMPKVAEKVSRDSTWINSDSSRHTSLLSAVNAVTITPPSGGVAQPYLGRRFALPWAVSWCLVGEESLRKQPH
jgi:hypothetical protein